MEIDNNGDGATDETRDPDFTETNYAPTERFSTANLSCGAHRITLMVNDSTGLTSTQAIALTITNDWTPGDLNHDGNVTSTDVLIALEIAVSGEYVPEADIDKNGCVNALDARMILQAAAGRIEL
jgi:hypothetical protein